MRVFVSGQCPIGQFYLLCADAARGIKRSDPLLKIIRIEDVKNLCPEMQDMIEAVKSKGGKPSILAINPNDIGHLRHK